MVCCCVRDCGETHPPNWLGWVYCANFWRCNLRRCFHHSLFDIIGLHVWFETITGTDEDIRRAMCAGIGTENIGPATRSTFLCEYCTRLKKQSGKALDPISLLKQESSIWKNYNSDKDNIYRSEQDDDDNEYDDDDEHTDMQED